MSAPHPHKKRNILITAALPYANGDIHLGHLVEYLQADFWARFQRMQGHDCAYICADDTHGTPIMVRAREEGITPEQLIANSWKTHHTDFSDMQIQFENFGSTNSAENRGLCEYFYSQLKASKHLVTKPIQQLYCDHDKMFLPDRFVKGTCPKCGTKDQYGDNCDSCGAAYSPEDMKESYCSICGNTPTTKATDHIFVRLSDFQVYLKSWLPAHTTESVTNKMMEWFKDSLRDWDITRDGPYFGFKIPGTEDKYFYVWVDAPMGYVASTMQYCKRVGKNFEDYWLHESKSEVYHLIGKDIMYFHTLFWPALLKAAGFRTPTAVMVHGRLMINGEKMSKSKGTMIPTRAYLNHLQADYLRYYYSTKISAGLDDFDLNFEDFVNRVNAELVGKITNLASRGAQMLSKKMDGVMSELDSEGLELVKKAQFKGEEIAKHMELRDFAKASTEIRALADEANKYFDEKAPWKTLEADPITTKKVLTATLNVFRILAIYMKPFLPVYANKVEKLFGEADYVWEDAKKVLTNHKIADYEHLISRIEAEKIPLIIEETKRINAALDEQRNKGKTTTAKSVSSATSSVAGAGNSKASSTTAEDRNAVVTSEIEMDDFMKIDLRIGKILEASEVKGSDKLLQLKVEIGEGIVKNIFAGIKSAYKPEQLVGRLTVVCANLKPRKMKFGLSEGMVLATGAGGDDLYILSPDSGAKPGQRVK